LRRLHRRRWTSHAEKLTSLLGADLFAIVHADPYGCFLAVMSPETPGARLPPYDASVKDELKRLEQRARALHEQGDISDEALEVDTAILGLDPTNAAATNRRAGECATQSDSARVLLSQRGAAAHALPAGVSASGPPPAGQ
jgi:hypothetical protein